LKKTTAPLLARMESALGKTLLELAIIAACYWLAIELGLLIVSQPEGIASIWPASGLALAVLLLRPRNRWAPPLLVMFCVNALGNLGAGNPLPVSLGYALANILEAFLCAMALSLCFSSRVSFERHSEILALVAIAVLVNGLTALLGAAVSALACHAPFWKSWQLWWISDGLGIVLVAPAIVSWQRTRLEAPTLRRLGETALAFLTLTALLWLTFDTFTVAQDPILRPYMLYPILLFLAFRFPLRGITAALVLISGFSIRGTMQGLGFFSLESQTRTERLISVQLFLLFTSLFGLILSAMVTERSRTAALLRDNQLRSQLAEQLGLAGSWVLDFAMQKIRGSAGALRIYGLRPDTADLDLELIESCIPERERVHQALVDLVEKGQDYDLEFSVNPLDGAAPKIVHSIARLEKDARGKPTRLLGFLQDVTSLKTSETALEKSVEENERLLHELQHRVKNSFAMISSLIFVSSKGADSPEVSNALEELDARVRAVAELYSLLYSRGSFSELRLDEYCLQVAPSLLGLSGKIALEAEMEALVVDAGTAAPLGLILTELLTNAVKHGFPDGRAGRIAIRLRATPAGTLLEVRDDGVGLPPGFDPSGNTGMGMGLVTGLARQIDGAFSMTSDEGGTTCSLEFPA
jgi:two-component sensor histidine kinase/integral membrane sensor domain MASE1